MPPLSKEAEKEVEKILNSGALASDPKILEYLKQVEQDIVQALGPDHFMASDSAQIHRFLVARKLKVEPTLEMIRAHTTWRAERLPISPTGKVLEELRKGKIEQRGFDKDGVPMVVINSGKFDPKTRDLRASVDAALFFFERSMEALPEGKSQFSILYNREDFSFFRNWDSELVKEVVFNCTHNYPERLSKVYVYPAGPLVTLMLKIIGPFLDPRTRGKIQVINSTKELLKHVPAEYVPVGIGGTSEATFDPDQFDGLPAAPASMAAAAPAPVNVS